MWLNAEDVALGVDPMPPSRTSWCQAWPSHQAWARALVAASAPNTSSRPGAHVATERPLAQPPATRGARRPPRPPQPLQPAPDHHLCQMALSVPLTTTSSRPAAHEATAGDELVP